MALALLLPEKISASIVGFPRLSNTCRALTRDILVIYFLIRLSISKSCLNKFSNLFNGTMLGPSDGALSGSW